MPEDPIKTAAREARKKRQLPEPRICPMCGESRLYALRAVPLERHHPAGRNHDPDLEISICYNCHYVETELNRRAGAEMGEQPSLPEKLVMMLRAVGTFLKSLGAKLLAWAQELAEFIESLDLDAEGWRTWTR